MEMLLAFCSAPGALNVRQMAFRDGWLMKNPQRPELRSDTQYLLEPPP